MQPTPPEPTPENPQEPPNSAANEKEHKRSTKATVTQRVQEIFKLRIGGAEFLDLREYADAPERAWGVSNTQLRRYIAAADALCEKLFDAKARHLINRHLLQRRQLYAHALGAGDFRTALAVLQDEAKLEALYDSDIVKRIEALEKAADVKKAR